MVPFFHVEFVLFLRIFFFFNLDLPFKINFIFQQMKYYYEYKVLRVKRLIHPPLNLNFKSLMFDTLTKIPN